MRVQSLFRGTILGAPGAGKGTISKNIVDAFDVVHLSSGDILRQAVASGSPLSETIVKYTESGKLVPDVLIMKIVTEKLNELSNRHWLCDGFPRTLVQAEKLFMSTPLNLAINLKVPDSVIIERVKGRLVHIPSGRTYNTDFKPPKVQGKDDVTGEPLVQRPDDKPEVVKERLNVYAKSIAPVIEFYRKKGILREFSGTQSVDLWNEIEPILLKYMKPKGKS